MSNDPNDPIGNGIKNAINQIIDTGKSIGQNLANYQELKEEAARLTQAAQEAQAAPPSPPSSSVE